MTPRPHFVVVGAGQAGANAVAALRREGFAGRLSLIGAEPHLPYERPPLSKGYLLGSAARESVFIHPEEWYGEQEVDLRTSCAVVAVDRHGHECFLDDGTSISFDRLLLATGSSPRRLDVPGRELAGIHYLRRLEDADELITAFASATDVVIVGAGWIGLETAAAARLRGLDVVLVESEQLPLSRILGADIARVFVDLHREKGVRLRLGTQVNAFLGARGAVERVRLATGEVLPADLVIVGVGIRPVDALARQAGLDVGDGIITDQHLRTSSPHVFAAGDVASAFHPFYGQRLRVEHWYNAEHQSAVAARGMLGHWATYDRLPFFFSDQYEMGMEYTGYAPASRDHELVVRGDLASREFIALWLHDGLVRAGLSMNTWGVSDVIGDLIRSVRPIDPHLLADVEVPLPELVPT
jgi:3-phenylpropionate/trans-cinnamate dioxygenase ferredoxin reductase subunit